MDDLEKRITQYLAHQGLSDIHVHTGAVPALRINGKIMLLDESIVTKRELQIFANQNLAPGLLQRWEQQKSLDTDIQCGEQRFRANFYFESGNMACVLRKVENTVPSMDALGLPASVKQALKASSGLVLVTGPTGAGKSTSMAAMINYLLADRPIHVITIEDPVEFRFESKYSIVSQRQIGTDVDSFAAAIRAALREDPDVILLGEMRDVETIGLALIAAELGHLVIATLHAGNCTDAVARVVHAFGVDENAADHVRNQLADSLQFIVSQHLLESTDGATRVATYEVMMGTHAVKHLIRDNKIFHLPAVIETSQAEGMITMHAFSKKLYAEGKIRNNAA